MQVCTSLKTDNHASTPPLSFLQAGCPSCRPANSVKALKAEGNTVGQCTLQHSEKSFENRSAYGAVDNKWRQLSLVAARARAPDCESACGPRRVTWCSWGRGTAKSINLGRCLQLIDSSRPVQRAILKSDHLVVLPTHPCRAPPGHRQRALTRPPTDDSGDLPLFCAEIRYDALLTVYFVSYAQVTA